MTLAPLRNFVNGKYTDPREPTVVSGLRQDDEMIQDEIFGPVITVPRHELHRRVVQAPGS